MNEKRWYYSAVKLDQGYQPAIAWGASATEEQARASAKQWTGEAQVRDLTSRWAQAQQRHSEGFNPWVSKAQQTRARRAQWASQRAEWEAEYLREEEQERREQEERRRRFDDLLRATQSLNAWHVLGLVPGSSPELVKSTFRRLAREHHPDLGGDRTRFEQVRAAYEQLTRATA